LVSGTSISLKKRKSEERRRERNPCPTSMPRDPISWTTKFSFILTWTQSQRSVFRGRALVKPNTVLLNFYIEKIADHYPKTEPLLIKGKKNKKAFKALVKKGDKSTKLP
jgi:hypothetical protein